MATSLFTNKGTTINTRQMLKADSYQELIEKINSRLGRKYSASKVRWIWEIQECFKNPDFIELENGTLEADYWKLIKKLTFTIERKANWLEYRYKNVRLSFHDFEAQLWKITYDAIEYYEVEADIESYVHAEFTLVETLEMFWKYRMIDFIKSSLYTEKHSPWYRASSLSVIWPDNSQLPEQHFIINETIKEMFSEEKLKKNELQLLEVIYNYHEDSLRNWGKHIGIDHPETVKRLYITLKRKLSKHNPFI